MIDYIKLRAVNTFPNEVLDNPNLHFERLKDSKGNSTSIYYKAEANNMLIKVYDSGYISVQGSLHKFYKLHGKNYDNFTHTELLEAIDRLCNWLQIEPKYLKIDNFEFGVNLTQLSKHPMEVLQGLLLHTTNKNVKYFKDVACSDGKGDYRQLERQRYQLKVYNKGLQYALPEETLRVEVKTRKLEHVAYTGLKYLSDFNDKEKLKRCLHILQRTWRDSLLFNLQWDNDLPNSKDWSNVQWWKAKSNKETTVAKRAMKKHKPVSLLIHQEINDKINSTWRYLLSN